LIKEDAHVNMRNQVLEKYRNQQQKVLKERT
jgi:hypothetical protein